MGNGKEARGSKKGTGARGKKGSTLPEKAIDRAMGMNMESPEKESPYKPRRSERYANIRPAKSVAARCDSDA